MIRFFKSLYLTNRFFQIFSLVVVLFVFGFFFSIGFAIAKVSVLVAIAFVLFDVLMIYSTGKVLAIRKTANVLSLGSDNTIRIELTSKFRIPVKLEVIDELPEQLQKRDFRMELSLSPGEKKQLNYQVRPTARGEYFFGKINLFASSFFGIVQRKIQSDGNSMVPVYPSIIEMKKYELRAFSKISFYQGMKKMRRLGHSYEFEQIKSYVRGDDIRSVNWRATGRANKLMVNHYEDEKAQQIYSVIDKSRSMKMAFNNLTLMDYSINTSLVLSNIALHKQDKVGLLTFSDKIGTSLKADRTSGQLRKILEILYKEKERNYEANEELLYSVLRNVVKGRSLIFLYTNFESLYALERVMPIIRKINHLHLLVVIFFENTELKEYAHSPANNMQEIYFKTIADKFLSEKQQMVQELRKYGVQTILTRPEDLSANTVNKYLELKARGMI